jgi:cytochrome P450
MNNGCPLPIASGDTGLNVLKGLARERSLLAAMEVMQAEVGPAFQITLPGFQPAVMVGPESNRQILVSEREHFHWRSESDPVTRLLRHGLLVEDGEHHACLRAEMEPVLKKHHVLQHIPDMVAYTDRLLVTWKDGSIKDMLVEMRRVALLIFMGTLLDVEFGPDLERLWNPVLRTIKYISPGLWIVWPDIPRPGYKKALRQIDEYLYGVIQARRADPRGNNDLLGRLIRVPGMGDDLVRDQLLTMLIAGHDTSTALLAWALHLLGTHPGEMAKVQTEVDTVLGGAAPTAEKIKRLSYLDLIIKETLRLFPPIHVGNRIVTEDTTISGYELAAGTRTMVSIYLSHRDERYWDEPGQFRPERFAKDKKRPPALTYIPFGGGPRNCIGASFAQIEAKVVLARILQHIKLEDTGRKVRPNMGATLEPHPGVFMRVRRRKGVKHSS